MNDELEKLRPEVREALKRADVTVEMFDTLVTLNRDEYDIIRAELLRLACENAELRHLPERICELRDAEAERDALRKRIDESRHVTIGSYPAHGFGYAQMICDPAKGISDKVYALVPLDDAEAAP